MKHIRIVQAFFLFLALSFGIFSQETGTPGDEAVFAPFISRLQVEVKNNLVRLSWVDSADVRGPVYVYRSTRPYENLRPAGISPVEVPYGVQFFVDEPDVSGTVYYFAAASDEAGQRYDVLIPNNNMAAVTLSGTGDKPQAARLSEPGIFNIGARAEGEGVVVSWNTTDGSRSAVLYRSVRPVRQTQDLINAVIVQAGAVPPFTDYPVPGVPFYYAVIFEDELTRGTVTIAVGSNATQDAVEVRPEKAPPRQAEMRAIPLPLLSVNNVVKDSDAAAAIQLPVPLNPEAAKAVADLKAEKTGAPLKRPRAFVQDLQTPAGGEESALRTIVQGPFTDRNWEASRAELVRYLSLPRAGQMEARARFYLGQSHYFSGSYREALIEFLSVQSLYPEEANEWIQEILSRLVN